ncbi:hypothetical protein RKD23_001049 [Streptomyces sp. SAI-170]
MVVAIGGPAFADVGQGQVRGEFGPRVEDGFAVLVSVVGERDGVAEQVTGGCDPSPDEQASSGESVEELRLAGGSGHGPADGFAQFLARGAFPLPPLGLVTFGAGGLLGGGAVPSVKPLEAIFGFDQTGFGLSAARVVVQPGPTAVFADEGGDDVDVVVGVADCRPAAAGVVAVGGDAGGRDHAPGDLAPLLVGQHGVLWRGAHGQVPYVLRGAAAGGEGLDWLVEQLLQVRVGGLRVAAGVRGQAVPSCHEVRVDVFLVGARSVQVVQQSDGALPALVDSRDHEGWFSVSR